MALTAHLVALFMPSKKRTHKKLNPVGRFVWAAVMSLIWSSDAAIASEDLVINHSHLQQKKIMPQFSAVAPNVSI